MEDWKKELIERLDGVNVSLMTTEEKLNMMIIMLEESVEERKKAIKELKERNKSEKK